MKVMCLNMMKFTFNVQIMYDVILFALNRRKIFETRLSSYFVHIVTRGYTLVMPVNTQLQPKSSLSRG